LAPGNGGNSAPGLGQFASTALLRWGDKVATENRGRASGKIVHSWQKWSIFMGKSPFTMGQQPISIESWLVAPLASDKSKKKARLKKWDYPLVGFKHLVF